MNALLQDELNELQDELGELKWLQEENRGFKVKDLEDANWCFRKMRAIKEAVEENKALIEAEKQRLEMWLTSENKKLEDDSVFFESVVQRYFLEEREKNPKFKLSTPYGKVSARKNEKWEYDDETTIKSLKGAGLNELIRIKEELDKTSLKSAKKEGKLTATEDGRLITPDGEVIDGVKISKVENISITSI